MKFKHYLYAAGLLLAGATTTAMVAADGDDPEVSPEFLYQYMVAPEDQETITSFSEIQLYFPNLPKMSYDEIMGGFMQMDWETGSTKIMAMNESGDMYTVMVGPYYMINQEVDPATLPDEGLLLGLMLFDENMEPVEEVSNGWYQIVFQEGAFVYEGVESPEIIMVYNLEATTIPASETPLELLNVVPRDGVVVKELSTIKVTFALPNQESQIGIAEKFLEAGEGAELQIKTEDGEWSTNRIIGGSKIAGIEPEVIEENGIVSALTFTLSFASVTKAGEYRLVLPKGLFYESQYNEETDSYGKFEGYQENETIYVYYTVDPEAKEPLDMVFNPEAGSNVASLNDVQIEFPNLTMHAMLETKLQDNYGQANIVASNEELGIDYIGQAELITGVDPEYAGETLVMCLSFLDGDYENVESFADGDWTISFKEGTFSYEGFESKAFTLDYTIIGQVSSLPEYDGTIGFSPAAGAEVSSLNTIEIVVSVGWDYEAFPVEEKVSSVTLTLEGGEPISAVSFGEPYEGSDATGDFATIIPVNFEGIEEAGTYTLDVPAGVINVANYGSTEPRFINPALTATYNFNPNAEGILDAYTLVPEAGSTVATLNDIQIAFPNVPGDALVSSVGAADQKITATNGDVTYYGSAKRDQSQSDCLHMTINFYDEEFSPAVFTDGVWTMTIAAGALSYQDNKNKEIVAEYTVEAPVANTFEIAGLKPFDGKTVRELSTITIEVAIPDNWAILMPQESMLLEVTLTDENGDSYRPLAIGEGEMNEMEGLYLFPIEFEPITLAGTYTLNIPEGFIAEIDYDENADAYVPVPGGLISAAVTAEYTVDPEAKNPLEMVFTPEEGSDIASLNDITIEFPNMTMREGFMMSNQTDQYGMPYVIATNVEAEVEYIGMAAVLPMLDEEYESETDTKVMGMRFYDAETEEEIAADAFAEGEWTIEFRAGTFSFEGDDSAAVMVVYNVDPSLTGINGVSASNDKVTVVSLDGRVVLQNASAAQLNSLEKGIYIVNGKKVVIRK